MSVGIYRVQYHLVLDMGTAEANWLINHMADVNDGQTMVSIDEDAIRTALRSAKKCERAGCKCAYFDPDDKLYLGPRAHKETTKTIAKKLRQAIKDSGQDMIDLSICW